MSILFFLPVVTGRSVSRLSARSTVYSISSRGTGAEALYLHGVGGLSGLRLLDGATLQLNSLNCYAKMEGEWVYLNGLFGFGIHEIAFGGGYLRAGESFRPADSTRCFSAW